MYVWEIYRIKVKAIRLKCCECNKGICKGQDAIIEKKDGQTLIYCSNCGQGPLREYELHQIECDVYSHGQE